MEIQAAFAARRGCGRIGAVRLLMVTAMRYWKGDEAAGLGRVEDSLVCFVFVMVADAHWTRRLLGDLIL
jgi:hypothetical protein